MLSLLFKKNSPKIFFFKNEFKKINVGPKKFLFGKSYLWVIVVKKLLVLKNLWPKIFVKISPPYARVVAMTAIQTYTLEIPFLK